MNEKSSLDRNPKHGTKNDKIQIQNLTIGYKTKSGIVFAVDNLSFSINDAEGIGIIGESGSGKSTIGYGIIRSLPANGFIESGRINYENLDLLSISKKEFDSNFRWKRIAMVFQGSMNSLDPVFTIKNQMIEILSTHSRVTILMKDRSGKIIRIRKTSRAEHNHKEIYSALNINTHNILKTIRR